MDLKKGENIQKNITREGFMLILSSPSGAGKTTISRRLLSMDDKLVMSISVTTRAKRPNEKEGVDYYFVSKTEFEDMKQANKLLESANVFGNYYGTPRKKIENLIASGYDVLFDIDWQGTRQLTSSSSLSDKVISIFILPPSIKELERRLYERATDSEEILKERMEKSFGEISHYNEYDYVLINDDLEKTIAHVRNILNAERLKRSRLTGLDNFVASNLLSSNQSHN